MRPKRSMLRVMGLYTADDLHAAFLSALRRQKEREASIRDQKARDRQVPRAMMAG